MTFNRRNYICFASILYVTSIPLTAQIKPDSSRKVIFSLAQIWEIARAGNKEVQIRILEQTSQQERVKDARVNRLPEIGTEGQYARVSKMPVYTKGIFNTPEQFPVLPSYYKLGANAYLNLYNGNKNILAIKSRQTDEKIAAVKTEMTISEVKLHASAYYLEIVKGLIFKNLLIQDIAAQQRQVVLIQNLHKSGTVLKSDVLKAELKISRQKLALMQVNDDLAIANQKLALFTGISCEDQIIPEQNFETDSISLAAFEEYLASALHDAYLLRISHQQLQLRKLELDEVRANVSPQIGLFANYAYSYPQIFLYPYSANVYGFGMAGIKASFAISSVYLNKHKVKHARQVYKIQEVEHHQADDQIRQQVYEAYLRCQEAIERIEVSKKNVLQAAESQRIVKNSYFNQFSLITDLLDADTELLQTHFDLAAARIASKFQYFHLLNITGQL